MPAKRAAETAPAPVARRRSQSYPAAVCGSTSVPADSRESPGPNAGRDGFDADGWPLLVFGSLSLKVAGVVR